jgi:polysaccharide biosynthesis/export protein
MLSRLNLVCLLAGSLVFTAGCASGRGTFVWVDEFPPAPETTGDHLLRPGDLLNIRVWDHEGLSARTRVRTDGKITMPLVDDLEVNGLTTVQLARLVETQLKQRNLVVKPAVNVVLEETKPLTVAVMGEVARAGMYTLDTGAGVTEALASAGGLTEFAHRDQIYVIRKTPQPVRIRFTYSALAEARGHAATFRLQPGDVIVAQ